MENDVQVSELSYNLDAKLPSTVSYLQGCCQNASIGAVQYESRLYRPTRMCTEWSNSDMVGLSDIRTIGY